MQCEMGMIVVERFGVIMFLFEVLTLLPGGKMVFVEKGVIS